MSVLPLLAKANASGSAGSPGRRRQRRRHALVAKVHGTVQRTVHHETPRRQLAALLPKVELTKILNMHGIRVSGFFDEDAKTLQKIFDKKYAEDCRHVEKIVEARYRQVQEQQHLTKIIRERKLQRTAEDSMRVKYPELAIWIDHLRCGKGEKSAIFRHKKPAFAFVVVKDLPLSSTLVSLELSSCELGNSFSESLNDMLRTNQSLKKLSLSDNKLGPRALSAVASALVINRKLVSLDLSSNPLTGVSAATKKSSQPVNAASSRPRATSPVTNKRRKLLRGNLSGRQINRSATNGRTPPITGAAKPMYVDPDDIEFEEPEEDVSGIHSFAEMLRQQASGRTGLRCIDFRHCGLHSMARKELARGIQGNHLVLELQLNQSPNYGSSAQFRIRNKLHDNVALHQLMQAADQEEKILQKQRQKVVNEKRAQECIEAAETKQSQKHHQDRVETRKQMVLEQFQILAQQQEKRRKKPKTRKTVTSKPPRKKKDKKGRRKKKK